MKSIFLNFVLSTRSDLGPVLFESLLPIIQYLYQDLVRVSLRDHLVGVSFGVSGELSGFSSTLMSFMGEF